MGGKLSIVRFIKYTGSTKEVQWLEEEEEEEEKCIVGYFRNKQYPMEYKSVNTQKMRVSIFARENEDIEREKRNVSTIIFELNIV